MLSGGEERLARAIDMLGGEGFAEALSEWLVALLAADNITVLAYFEGRAPHDIHKFAFNARVHRNFERVYVAGAYLLDPFHDLHVTRAERGVYRLNEVAPDQFHRNPYYLDYYAQTTLLDEMAFVAYPSEAISVHVCVGRDARSNRRFSARQVAQARQVAPVVIALAERQWADLAAQGAYSGDGVVERLIAALTAAHGVKLSKRQAEVALLILRGHSSVSIGLRLGISPQTVKVFRKQLYRKCRISSQAELFNLLLPLLGG